MSSIAYITDLPELIKATTSDDMAEPFTAYSITWSAHANGDYYRESIQLSGRNDYGRRLYAHLDGRTHADLPEPPQWFIDAARCLQMDAEAGR